MKNLRIVLPIKCFNLYTEDIENYKVIIMYK
jgi:hypothetical protein